MKTIRTRAVTLVELLVVLAILAGMIGLLLPATQRARASARNSVCQNNLRQITLARHSHQELGNEFPTAGQSWTVTLLQWMEERALMELIQQGNLRAANEGRPPIYRCPSQPDPILSEGAMTCHYTVEVTRNRRGKITEFLGIRDRHRDFEAEELRPWYDGPFAGQMTLTVSETKGPHSGLFNGPQ